MQVKKTSKLIWTFFFKVDDEKDSDFEGIINKFTCTSKELVSINYHCNDFWILTTKKQQMAIDCSLLTDIEIHYPQSHELIPFPVYIEKPYEKMEYFWFLMYQYNSKVFPQMDDQWMNEEYGNEANFRKNLAHTREFWESIEKSKTENESN